MCGPNLSSLNFHFKNDDNALFTKSLPCVRSIDLSNGFSRFRRYDWNVFFTMALSKGAWIQILWNDSFENYYSKYIFPVPMLWLISLLHRWFNTVHMPLCISVCVCGCVLKFSTYVAIKHTFVHLMSNIFRMLYTVNG